MSSHRERVFEELGERLSKIMIPEKKVPVFEVCSAFRKVYKQDIDEFLKSRDVRDFRTLTDVFRECESTDVIYQENGKYMVKFSNPEYISPEEREALRRGTIAGYRRDLADGVIRNVPQIGLNLASQIFRECFSVRFYPVRAVQSGCPTDNDIAQFFGLSMGILVKNLESVGIKKMTPLQVVALPLFRDHFYLDFFIHAAEKRGVSMLLYLAIVLACLNRTGACLALLVTESEKVAAQMYKTISTIFEGLPFTCYLSKTGDSGIVMDAVYIADVSRFRQDLAERRLSLENVFMFAVKDVEPDHFQEHIFESTYGGFKRHYRIFCTKDDDAETRSAFIKFCGVNTEFGLISQSYF
uniref:Uncharacterized protein n=1 Tax=Panagrolaimus sp. JU765 TaxID=591449 RepID=A0AC34QDM4_9BILA